MVSEATPSANAPDSASGKGPVGSGNHIVRQGDCVESIAYQHGHLWKTLWNHPQNAKLKQVRKDPNVLLPGDRIFIPELRVKEEAGGTEQRHRFCRKSVPSKLKLRFLDAKNRPRAGESYALEVDGTHYDGSLDSDGALEVSILPNARKGKLTLGQGDEQEEYELELGHLDPLAEVSGVQARLMNLGYDCGAVDGKSGPEIEGAIEAFQEDNDLKPTGKLDQTTLDKLFQIHDKGERRG